jgi:hypothetical protein
MNVKRNSWYKLGIEFVLVIAGILIALAIDNWSKQRESRQLEVQLLEQVRQDLVRDTEALEAVRSRRERAAVSIRSVMEMMESEDPDLSQLEHHLSRVFTVSRIELRDGAYEIIKSSALVLSDPELRIALSDYYEYHGRIFKGDVGDIEYSFMEFWLPYVIANIEDWEYEQYARPVDPAALLADRQFSRLLRSELNNNEAILEKAPELDAQIWRLIEMIDANLGR